MSTKTPMTTSAMAQEGMAELELPENVVASSPPA